MTSTNGSCTARSLLTRGTVRPLTTLHLHLRVPVSTALYSTPLR